jgi:hypothetical protein
MTYAEAHDCWGHKSKILLGETSAAYGIKLTGTHTPCKGCGYAQAKQRAVSSKTTNTKPSKPGGRIFLDAAGPYLEILGGNKYWFEVVDDKTRTGWDHFSVVKSKLVVFARALLVKLKVQEHPVKYLRCNNVGETVRPLKSLCGEFGIMMELTAPDTPQHNGVVKRRIAVLTQRADALMMAVNLNKQDGRTILWVEAVHTVNTLENITSTTMN